jgi:hypothetical protein
MPRLHDQSPILDRILDPEVIYRERQSLGRSYAVQCILRERISEEAALDLVDAREAASEAALLERSGLGFPAVRRRMELVRRAKDRVGGRGLSNDELDRILPPVDCRRTRQRLARRAEA